MHRTFVALLALSLIGQRAGAQMLPAAALLVARHDSLVGGRAALEAHQSMRMLGSFTIAAAGIDAPLEILKRRPNQYVFRAAIPEFGDVMQGFDGTTAWAVQPGQGATVLSGPAAARIAEQADFFGDLHDLSRFSSVETVERTDFFGVLTFKVRLTRPTGEVLYEYFNAATGLSAGASTSASSPVGPQENITVFAEYQDFGGVRLASRVVQRQPQFEIVIRIVAVEFDRLDDAAMAPPDAVRELLGRSIVPPPPSPSNPPPR